MESGIELIYFLKHNFSTSGCGKTRTCFDLGRIRFIIYFDCFADQDIQLLIEKLKVISLPKKTAEAQVEFEKVSLKLIQCLFISRLIVLTQLRKHNSSLEPFEWLCYQRSRRTQQLFKAIFFKLSENSCDTISRLFSNFGEPLLQSQQLPLLLIFDESQQLLDQLENDYCSISSNKKGISNFKFEHPRSLFSFLARCVVNYESIWCGTHMRIRNMELFSSAAAGKPEKVFVFTDFNYLQPQHIAILLERFLAFSITDSRLLGEICHFLQGRPRFISQFLINLVTSNSIGENMAIIQEKFNNYREMLISSQQSSYIGSLYAFWADRFSAVIGSLTNITSQKQVVSQILLESCVSSMFSDSPGQIEFNPEIADMVSTGLVMISKIDDKYHCFMVEPMSISAGLNYFAAQNPYVILDYFSSQLFTSTTNARNFTPQQRGNLMELVIAVRFLQGWWLESCFAKYLPSDARSIAKPIGVIDCRNAKNDDFNYFFQNLENHQFPLLILPSTNAAPDISYSRFNCYIKTTWTSNSKTSIFVNSGECNKNISTMNPKNWYKSSSLEGQCQKILDNSGSFRFIHIRFELPFTAPGQKFISCKSDSDETIICVDLSQPFAKEFFGEAFVEKYKEYISSVVEDTTKLKYSK